MKIASLVALSLMVLLFGKSVKADTSGVKTENRPNILFCLADDWGWPHAGAYGDPVVRTPTFDRLAKEGVLFEHAFISSPSCTPSRNAVLTGQQFFRLGSGANLYGALISSTQRSFACWKGLDTKSVTGEKRGDRAILPRAVTDRILVANLSDSMNSWRHAIEAGRSVFGLALPTLIGLTKEGQVDKVV
jgi:hypothetical protein